MIPDLARMAIVIKSEHETSVLTGNYEFFYSCGLLSCLSGIPLPSYKTPAELQEKMTQALENYHPQNEREKNLIHMIKYYKPDENMDEQVLELLQMGLTETRPWQR